ncbi:hypothetical protein O6H91_04G008100 [Diphasiastrum complanatum]|uniref:Uncharacterized protein n=2 Tax=Diphasiastrum complanatum TaxID=34168 RepID=A0ACC2DUB8_DIPCM|nr:hypothetical protein O6H91_04G008100 [Diphasiastrum complanatum]KAJ7557754.1 hypothetical protein O6H91_04G008100 [Diphasiastrum complanatum]
MDYPACSELETGMKRRRRSAGSNIERRMQIAGLVEEIAYNRDVEGLLEILLLKDGSFSLLSQAVENLFGRQVSEKEKVVFLERSQALGLQIQDVAGRLAREHARRHNILSWPLNSDLTVKIFSLLETQTLSKVGVTCTMFNKLVMEAACYTHVDLTQSLHVTNRTVAKIIQRAGHLLRSLKLGVVPRQSKSEDEPFKHLPLKPGSRRSLSMQARTTHLRSLVHERGVCSLTRFCLDPLLADNGVAGEFLQKLHLYHIEEMDSNSLCRAITACPSLLDIELVGLHISMKALFECLAVQCSNLKRLCCQAPKLYSLTNGWDEAVQEAIKAVSCTELAIGCPNITFLALRGYKLRDRKVSILLMGLSFLTHLDLSGADHLTGSFLRDITCRQQQSLLNTILLRDCVRLKEVEVEHFLFALSTGEGRNLRLLDISNKDGLAASNWFDRRPCPNMEAISRVRSERPELHLLANFTEHKSDSESMVSSFSDSDDSGNLQLAVTTSDDSSEDSSISSSSSSEDDDDADDSNDSGFGNHGMWA